MEPPNRAWLGLSEEDLTRAFMVITVSPDDSGAPDGTVTGAPDDGPLLSPGHMEHPDPDSMTPLEAFMMVMVGNEGTGDPGAHVDTRAPGPWDNHQFGFRYDYDDDYKEDDEDDIELAMLDYLKYTGLVLQEAEGYLLGLDQHVQLMSCSEDLPWRLKLTRMNGQECQSASFKSSAFATTLLSMVKSRFHHWPMITSMQPVQVPRHV